MSWSDGLTDDERFQALHLALGALAYYRSVEELRAMAKSWRKTPHVADLFGWLADVRVWREERDAS